MFINKNVVMNYCFVAGENHLIFSKTRLTGDDIERVKKEIRHIFPAYETLNLNITEYRIRFYGYVYSFHLLDSLFEKEKYMSNVKTLYRKLHKLFNIETIAVARFKPTKHWEFIGETSGDNTIDIDWLITPRNAYEYMVSKNVESVFLQNSLTIGIVSVSDEAHGKVVILSYELQDIDGVVANSFNFTLQYS